MADSFQDQDESVKTIQRPRSKASNNRPLEQQDILGFAENPARNPTNNLVSYESGNEGDIQEVISRSNQQSAQSRLDHNSLSTKPVTTQGEKTTGALMTTDQQFQLFESREIDEGAPEEDYDNFLKLKFIDQ